MIDVHQNRMYKGVCLQPMQHVASQNLHAYFFCLSAIISAVHGRLDLWPPVMEPAPINSVLSVWQWCTCCWNSRDSIMQCVKPPLVLSKSPPLAPHDINAHAPSPRTRVAPAWSPSHRGCCARQHKVTEFQTQLSVETSAHLLCR